MRKVGVLALGLMLTGSVALSSAAMAAGDVANGEKIFRKCKACHALEAGKKKIGPSLHGVFGRKAGGDEGFKYSKAMMDSGVVWDESTMDQYLADPKGFIPKNRMAFPGIKKEDERADLIAYLKGATM